MSLCQDIQVRQPKELHRAIHMVCDQCQNVVVTFYVFKQKVRWSQSRGCPFQRVVSGHRVHIYSVGGL